MKTPSACTKPWLEGWCGLGVAHGGDVGGRAHAGLVGEQAALDAVQHRRRRPAGDAARRLLRPKALPTMMASMPGTSPMLIATT
jgi:hypothetical protein